MHVPISEVANRMANTPDAAPTMAAKRLVSLRRPIRAKMPARPRGTAAAISATPVQWHFIGTVLPSAVVSVLPCDSQSVKTGAIANTNARTIIAMPRTLVISPSTLNIVSGGHSRTVMTPSYQS